MSDGAYTKAKKTIDKVHGDGISEVDTEYKGDIKGLIQRTFSEIIQYDKIELQTIINECLAMYKDNEDVVSILCDLSKLLQVFYREKIVNNEPVIDTITILIKRLDDIPKIKQLRLETLLFTLLSCPHG